MFQKVMNSQALQSNGYSLTMNPRRVALQPNKLMHSIYPTRHGQLLPSTPTFFFLQDDDHIEDEAEYVGLKNKPDSKGKLIASPSNENIYITSYSGKQPFSGPIEKLSVLLIGNEEIPDVTMFASSVKSVEVIGHLSFTGPAFNIIRQLPAVTKVKFFIGRSQLPIFRENYDFDYNIPHSATQVCPNVESLEIVMDLECYYETPWFCPLTCFNCGNHCWDMMKSTFDSLVESLLSRSKESFPNLKFLYTDLPDTDIYYGGITSLIESSKYLVDNTYIKAIEGPIPDDLEAKTKCDKSKLSTIHAMSGEHPSSWIPLPNTTTSNSEEVKTDNSSQSTEDSSKPSCCYSMSIS